MVSSDAVRWPSVSGVVIFQAFGLSWCLDALDLRPMLSWSFRTMALVPWCFEPLRLSIASKFQISCLWCVVVLDLWPLLSRSFWNSDLWKLEVLRPLASVVLKFYNSGYCRPDVFVLWPLLSWSSRILTSRVLLFWPLASVVLKFLRSEILPWSFTFVLLSLTVWTQLPSS
jgi:hypothetical protein